MYISDSIQIMNITLSSNSATGFSSDGFTPNITKYSPTQACKKNKQTHFVCEKHCRCDLALFLKVWPREPEIQVC